MTHVLPAKGAMPVPRTGRHEELVAADPTAGDHALGWWIKALTFSQAEANWGFEPSHDRGGASGHEDHPSDQGGAGQHPQQDLEDSRDPADDAGRRQVRSLRRRAGSAAETRIWMKNPRGCRAPPELSATRFEVTFLEEAHDLPWCHRAPMSPVKARRSAEVSAEEGWYRRGAHHRNRLR